MNVNQIRAWEAICRVPLREESVKKPKKIKKVKEKIKDKKVKD